MANTDANDLGLEHHYSHAHPGTFSLRLYKEERKQAFAIQGVWILERIKNYDGQETKYNNENNSQWLGIYDDSCFYECKHPKTIIIHGKESCKENCNYRCNHVNHYG